jgi:hypothetical protein
VINFVGGWSGTRCQSAAKINQTLFARGAGYPGLTLWLYGDDDPFYSLAHSRENFAAFQAAGGRGTFLVFPRPAGDTGHRLSRYPSAWTAAVETYLTQQGLPIGGNPE